MSFAAASKVPVMSVAAQGALLSADQRYARCEALIVAWEGGPIYTNNPKDPGGPTRWGVTLKALSDWRGHMVAPADVQALTATEAAQIYRAVYWTRIAGDQLPAGVDLMVFDAAVNMGRNRAAKCLQLALGVPDDGAIGPRTLAAVAAVNDRGALIDRIRARRAALYGSFDGYATFGRGWMRRLETCAVTAKAWAGRA
jgi:lysozyme family protein